MPLHISDHICESWATIKIRSWLWSGNNKKHPINIDLPAPVKPNHTPLQTSHQYPLIWFAIRCPPLPLLYKRQHSKSIMKTLPGTVPFLQLPSPNGPRRLLSTYSIQSKQDTFTAAPAICRINLRFDSLCLLERKLNRRRQRLATQTPPQDSGWQRRLLANPSAAKKLSPLPPPPYPLSPIRADHVFLCES